jgi:hypothetical protein
MRCLSLFLFIDQLKRERRLACEFVGHCIQISQKQTPVGVFQLMKDWLSKHPGV